MSARAKAYLYLFITTLIWAWASPVIKFTTGYLPPLIFLEYRFFVSSIIALFFLPSLRKQLPRTSSAWAKTFIYGFMSSTVTLSLVFVGASYSSSLVLAMSSAAEPIITSLAGIMFLKEHVTTKEKRGLALAFFGTLLITFEPLLKSGFVTGTLLGNFLLFISRITDSASSVIGKKILRVKVSPLALTHLSFIIGFITLMPIVLSTNTPSSIYHLISNIPLTAHLGILYMAILSGTLAYSLWLIAVKSIEIGEASVSYYLTPLLAAPLSILWLHEPLTPIFIIGCLIIFSGVVLAQYRRHLI